MSKNRLASLPALLLTALALSASATLASAQVPSPTLEGPIAGPGTPFVAGTGFDLAPLGYAQQEYFIAGTARAFTNAGPLEPDGVWEAVPGETADYTTRILVHRPMQRGRFNGTVIVEWFNVSGGLDASPDWTTAHTELIRRGYAWVGVSAQFVGVEGGGGIGGLPDFSLKSINPARYGALVHPGDSFSYDIFSQAARAIREPSGVSPLGDLKIARVIAVGESQSAFRLVTYINAIHPLAGLYDGFLVHSRAATSAPLSQEPQPAIPAPSVVWIRPDLDVPVLTFQTETDLTLLRSFFSRQPDTARHRLWEVAGTAHADTYTLLVGATDLGDSPEVADLVITASPIPGILECGEPVNSGPQHWVLKAAFRALERWVRLGTPPASAPRLEVSADPEPVIARDAHGNALGGIRTPQVDVPIATLSGEGQVGSILCLLFGTTVPFDDALLAELYPSPRAYRKAFGQATRRAVRAGWILRPDARLMLRFVKTSSIGD
ncbi:MAG: hypothetical protein JSU66_16970 [Deltaproteobacteria bacterium]|nr:MAG: hypothetical protein JSU66_16970 [Deltaproteobacteria bacterium]